MASYEVKNQFEVEEMNLLLVKADIKYEEDTDVFDGTAVQDVLPLLRNKFEMEEIRFLTPKVEQCDVKNEDITGISVASSSPSHVPGMGMLNAFAIARGKCPGCRRPFALNVCGFNDIARHIFFNHKKNCKQYLFILRMLYGSPHSFAVDGRRHKESSNRAVSQMHSGAGEWLSLVQ